MYYELLKLLIGRKTLNLNDDTMLYECATLITTHLKLPWMAEQNNIFYYNILTKEPCFNKDFASFCRFAGFTSLRESSRYFFSWTAGVFVVK